MAAAARAWRGWPRRSQPGGLLELSLRPQPPRASDLPGLPPPEVSEGDKRILLVDGEPVGVINRVPATGQVRSNLSGRGRAEAVDLIACATANSAPSSALNWEAAGLLFVGIDVIGRYLTEITVTSPTGAQQLKRLAIRN